MKINFWSTILIAFLMSSCATIQPKNIRYNSAKRIYEYQANKRLALTLRNENQQLVDTLNYEQFEGELAAAKRRYPFKHRLENDYLLKNIDIELSTLYARANQSIVNREFERAINDINKIATVYPDIYKYSDAYYLKGYAFEHLGMADSAQISYESFLKKSSQKYSTRFRGNRDNDLNDSVFIVERNYADNYLQHREQEAAVKFDVIKPKYYFGSFQPGYTLNKEDLPKKSTGLFMFLIGSDFSNESTLGGQFCTKLSNYVDINPRFVYSENLYEFSLALPIQVYKSDNNDFGVKFTPFFNYLSIDSVKIDGTKYLFEENVFNFGGRISVGYYLGPRLALGAYYQYNYYNANNKIHNTQSQIDIWLANEYDMSFYYNICKGVTVKGGVKNEDFVAGLLLSGWEISYNISTPGLLMRVDMY